jgi:DNA-binding PadR family transcriptional regulator
MAGAPLRKYYQLTLQGQTVYSGLLQSWTQLQNATAQVLAPNPKQKIPFQRQDLKEPLNLLLRF